MSIHPRVLRAAVIAVASLLTGCRTFTPDAGMSTVAEVAGQELNKDVVKINSEEDAARTRGKVSALLRAPLDAEAAVQVALLNNLALQASYNRLGVAEAVTVQASRPPLPTFSFEKVSTSLELDIERKIVASILSLATWPARKKLAGIRFEQAQFEAAAATLNIAAETRRAYINAVAAREVLAALEKDKVSAQSAAELAGNLVKTGALNELALARHKVFAAEVTAQVARAKQQSNAARERLTRLMGLWDYDVASLLPGALPPLPAHLRSRPEVTREAMQRRVDLAIARFEVEALAKSFGLTRKTRFINVLDAGAISKTQKDTGEPGADGGGFDIEFQVPLYDFGKARVREAEQRYLEAVNGLGAKAVNAASEAREAYARYRSSYGVARQYEKDVLPLRQTISAQMQLQYNAMQVDAFALIESARAYALAQVASIEARRDFWLASVDLSVAILGGGSMESAASPVVAVNASAVGEQK